MVVADKVAATVSTPKKEEDVGMIRDASDEAMNFDPVSRDHCYALHPSLIARKSRRIRMPTNRLNYVQRNICVVCGTTLKDIGLKLDSVVCSVECLTKNSIA